MGKEGKTALHHAARLGLLNVVQVLVSRGADMETADVNGQTVIQCLRVIVQESFWNSKQLAVATCLGECRLEWQSLFFLPAEHASVDPDTGLAHVARIIVGLKEPSENQRLWTELKSNILQTIPEELRPLIAIESVKTSQNLYSFGKHIDVESMSQCDMSIRHASCHERPPQICSGDRTVVQKSGTPHRFGTLGGLILSKVNEQATALTCGHVITSGCNPPEPIVIVAGDHNFGNPTVKWSRS